MTTIRPVRRAAIVVAFILAALLSLALVARTAPPHAPTTPAAYRCFVEPSSVAEGYEIIAYPAATFDVHHPSDEFAFEVPCPRPGVCPAGAAPCETRDPR